MCFDVFNQWWDCWDLKCSWFDSGTLTSQILRRLDVGRRKFRSVQKSPCAMGKAPFSWKFPRQIYTTKTWTLKIAMLEGGNSLARPKLQGTHILIYYIYIHGMYGLNLELCFLVQHGCWKSSTEKQVGLTKDLPRPNRDTVESLMKRFDTSGKKTLNVKDFFECLRLQLLDVGWWVKRFVYHRSLWEGRDDFNLFFHPKSWRRFRRWNPFNLSILCWRVETTNQLSFSTRVRCACVLRSTQLHLSDNRCFPTKFVSSEHLV